MPTEKMPSQESSVFATRQFSRRRMLQTMAVSSLTLVGGSVLAACGGSTSPADTKVTLYVGDWPVSALPPEADQKKKASTKVYADVLKTWMQKNPGVDLKKSTVDIWSGEKLVTAISSGTAPAIYPSGPLGAYKDESILAALVKGMGADVTELHNKYKMAEKMPDYARNSFERWRMSGKLYVAPADYFAGNGIIYRRDLYKEAGLEEPKLGWTWSQFASNAKALTKGKVKGASVQQWILDWVLSANGFNLFSRVPAPAKGWHWTYDYTTNMSKWQTIGNLWRQMYAVDKTVYADTTYDDSAVAKSFARGDSAMQPNNYGFFARHPTDPESLAPFAEKLGKSVDEVFGFVAHPVGETGMFGNSQGSMGSVCFDPKLKGTSLDKAYSAYEYLLFGQGYIDQKVGIYKATKDIRYVYDSVAPRTKVESFPGVPGTVEEAWGKQYVQAVRDIIAIPSIPNIITYFPPEKSVGPTNDAYNDARSAITFTQKNIVTTLENFNKTINQQAAGFTSSVSKEEFVTGARKYYSDLDAFWKQHAPQFYELEFKPWYQSKVLPALQ